MKDFSVVILGLLVILIVALSSLECINNDRSEATMMNEKGFIWIPAHWEKIQEVGK